MNILDENTKAMLENGGAVILTSKYEANDSFIQQGCKCHFCGKESDFTEYIMTVSGGYNSDHDMEAVTLEVCAECLETMLAAVN